MRPDLNSYRDNTCIIRVNMSERDTLTMIVYYLITVVTSYK